MSRLISVLRFLALLLVLTAPVAAFAQATPAAVIVVMDENAVLTNSDAGKSALAQLKTIGDQIGAELDTERKALEAEKTRIGQQRATLTQDQFKARVAALEKRAGGFERLVEARGKEMEATRQNALKIINTALQPVLEEIVKSRGATIMVDRANLIYVAPALDVTGDVIAKLNARLKPFTVQRIKPTAPVAAKPAPAATR